MILKKLVVTYLKVYMVISKYNIWKENFDRALVYVSGDTTLVEELEKIFVKNIRFLPGLLLLSLWKWVKGYGIFDTKECFF